MNPGLTHTTQPGIVNIAGTALYPFVDLSVHCVIPVVVFDVIVVVSAASSQRDKPETAYGEYAAG
jgi:hypothetical protein